MPGATGSALNEVPWGRVTVVAGGLVVAYGVMRGAYGALRIAANEVMYRVGGAGPWTRPDRHG